MKLHGTLSKDVLLDISGEDPEEDQAAQRWAQVWVEGCKLYVGFWILYQNYNLDVFMLDNFNTHKKNVAVIAMIQHYGHGIVFRASYWFVAGPIEFIFNTIPAMVWVKLYDMSTGVDL